MKTKKEIKEQRKQYRIDNKERIKKYNLNYKKRRQKLNKENKYKIKLQRKQYYIDNKDKIKEYREKTKKERSIYMGGYWVKNQKQLKQYNKQYIKNRRKTNSIFKLCCSLRTRTYQIMKAKGFSKSQTFYDYIGCTGEELYKHIESQFTKGMSWDLMGQIHLDHRIPLANATTEEEVYKLCHYTNLQPLWAFDNLSKGGKIE